MIQTLKGLRLTRVPALSRPCQLSRTCLPLISASWCTLLRPQVLPRPPLAPECVRFALAGWCEPAAPSLLCHAEPNHGGCSWTQRLGNKRLISGSPGGGVRRWGALREQRDKCAPTSRESSAEEAVTDGWRLARACISGKCMQLCLDMNNRLSSSFYANGHLVAFTARSCDPWCVLSANSAEPR